MARPVISTAVPTFSGTNPLFALYYTHIHWNDKKAIGTSVPMAFLRLMRQRSCCDIFMAAFGDGKESGSGRIAGFHITLEPKAGDIDFYKLQ